MIGAALCLVAFVCAALTSAQLASASDLECPITKAVYAPYHDYKRSDGARYEITVSDLEDMHPGPSAKVYLTTYAGDNTPLSRLTMQYGCYALGDATCFVGFSNKKADEKKGDRVNFDVIALTSDFNETSFYGHDNAAPHALIFPEMRRKFRFNNIDWSKFKDSIQFFKAKTVSAEIAPDEFTPEIWVLSKCDR